MGSVGMGGVVILPEALGALWVSLKSLHVFHGKLERSVSDSLLGQSSMSGLRETGF